MTFLPCVTSARHCGGFRIHVTFNDNSAKTIDFRQWLVGPMFKPLKDPAYFQRFFVEGGTLAWPNGADIAPETLYAASATSSRRSPQKPLHPARTRRKTGQPQSSVRR